MRPGRELDALVAEKVMGAKWRLVPDYPGGACDLLELPGHSILVERRCSDGRTLVFAGTPHYSTEIAAAWEVGEETVEKTQYRFQCGYDRNLEGKLGWYAFFGDPRTASGAADTAPHAICLAALRACGVEVEQ